MGLYDDFINGVGGLATGAIRGIGSELQSELSPGGPDPAVVGKNQALGQPFSADQMSEFKANQKRANEQATTSGAGVRHGDASWQSDMYNPSTNKLSSAMDPLIGRSGKTPPPPLPSSLKGYQFTSDPWIENGTAGQIEGDIAAHKLINQKYDLANQNIEKDYAERYPDSTRLAVNNADLNAKLAASKMLANDPLAMERAKANIDSGQKLGVYQGERQLDLATENQRSAKYLAVDSQRQDDLAKMKSDPRYRALSQPEQQAKEAELNAHYDSLKEALKAGSTKFTGKTD